MYRALSIVIVLILSFISTFRIPESDLENYIYYYNLFSDFSFFDALSFSGKDPSKVDRSGAYATRHIAKNLVAAGLCKQVLVQVSYAIGVAKPTSINVETYGTATVDLSDGEISKIVEAIFDMRPYFIEKRLKLRSPIYSETAAYGHMGRTPEVKTVTFSNPMGETVSHEVETFTWEKLDYVEKIKNKFNI